MRDVVKNLEAVHEFRTLLREKDPRKEVLVEPILDSEVTLEMVVKEVREFVLEILGGARLSKREVFVVRKHVEVLLEDVLEIIEHCEERVDLIRVDSSCPYFLIIIFHLWTFLFIFSLLKLLLRLDRLQLMLKLCLEPILE